MKYSIVTPQGEWTKCESSHLRGSPATHAVRQGESRTLCGRLADGWLWQDAADPTVTLGFVNCKQCLAALEKGEADEAN